MNTSLCEQLTSTSACVNLCVYRHKHKRYKIHLRIRVCTHRRQILHLCACVCTHKRQQLHLYTRICISKDEVHPCPLKEHRSGPSSGPQLGACVYPLGRRGVNVTPLLPQLTPARHPHKLFTFAFPGHTL